MGGLPDGNAEIYYKRSVDGGVSWGTDTRLSDNTFISLFPSISVSGSNVHLVWYDYRDGNFEIYYKRSSDGGTNWETDTRLTNDPFVSGHPCVFANGSIVHVSWGDTRDGGAREIYYKRSTDRGGSWENDTRISFNPGDSRHSSVSASGSDVHLLWIDDRDGNYEVYYNRSADGGISWEPDDTRLTNTFTISEHPSISSSGSALHVVWTDGPANTPDIFYRRSTDGGLSWQAGVQLTNNTPANSVSPSVALSGSNVHVVWQDNSDGNNEIYYKQSLNEGVTWGTESRLTNNSGSSETPFVAVSGSSIHVVWQDNRNVNFEIYYKLNPTGNPIGIKIISSQVPNEFSLSQNYPNPFNPTTIIKFAVPKSSFISLKIYNMIGSEIATLVNELLQPGTYEVDFEGSKLSSGIYFYALKAGSYADTKRMILLK